MGGHARNNNRSLVVPVSAMCFIGGVFCFKSVSIFSSGMISCAFYLVPGTWYQVSGTYPWLVSHLAYHTRMHMKVRVWDRNDDVGASFSKYFSGIAHT